MDASSRHTSGEFIFRDGAFLAPMEGITNPAFRDHMAARGGLDVVCTEFVRVTDSKLGPKLFQRQVARSEATALSVQVMGNNPRRMAEAASIAQEAGADIVDINLGCPMPRIVRKGVGAALLKNLPLLSSVLGSMRKAVRVRLSAKIRAGYDDADHVLEIGHAVEDAGVDFVTVHPRRRTDFYRGVSDWRIIGRLKRELSIAVVGNGDVWCAADALRMQRETGCDAVMIGRPALRNPWIFQQIAALRQGTRPCSPGGADLLDYLAELRALYAARSSDDSRVLGKLKEHVRWLGRSVDDDGAFRNRALRVGALDELFEVARQELSGLPAAALDLGAAGPSKLEFSGRAVMDSGVRTPAVPAL